MQILDSPFIQYKDRPATEAWLNNVKVWGPSIYSWVVRDSYTRAWNSVVYGTSNNLLVAGNNGISLSNDNGITWQDSYEFHPTEYPDIFDALAWGVSGSTGAWVTVETQLSSTAESGYSYPRTAHYYMSPQQGPTATSDWTQYLMPHPLSASFMAADLIYSDFWNRYIGVGDPNVLNLNGTSDSVYPGMGDSLIGLSGTVGCYLSAGNFSTQFDWVSAALYNVGGSPIASAIAGYARVVEATHMGNHRIAACGSGGATKFGYSDDGGATWRQARYNNNQEDTPRRVNLQTGGHTWHNIAYGYDPSNTNLPLSGRLVGVNGNAAGQYTTAYSDDGINWYQGTPLPAPYKGWTAVTYAEGRFIMLGSGSALGVQAVSEDGINWTPFVGTVPTLEPGTTFKDMVVANSRLVACGVRSDSSPSSLDSIITADFIITNISLLMHMDGTNGSQTFIDSSSNSYSLTANGDAQISTAIADPFGGSTSLFDANDDYVEVPVDAGEFGSGDFTIECWIYANTTSNLDTVISKGVLTTVDNKAWTLEWNSGRLAFFGYGELSTGIVRTNNTLNTGTWYHVAVVKHGSNFRMYLDGVDQTDHSGNPTINTLDTGGVLLVGSGFYAPTTRTFDGYIDELRITKGDARYTSNFTPPTGPYPNPGAP